MLKSEAKLSMCLSIITSIVVGFLERSIHEGINAIKSTA